jgi:hypothetical protein
MPLRRVHGLPVKLAHDFISPNSETTGGRPRRFRAIWNAVIGTTVIPGAGGKSRPAVSAVGRGALRARA